MINRAQIAIVRKDMHETMINKTVKISMILVPMMMTIILPCIFTAIAYYAPGEMDDITSMIALLPIRFSVMDTVRVGYYYFMNYLTPMFFLLIPVMASSVAAGSSFVGEKERRTLETLLYSPLTVKQIFTAKVIAALGVALIVTAISFAGYIAVAIAGSALVYGSFVLDLSIWAAIMLLVVPSISLIGVTAIVLASARARTFQEAQQYAAILILPVMMMFLIPQMTGLFLLDATKLTLIGLAFFAVAIGLTHLASRRFTPEKLLR